MSAASVKITELDLTTYIPTFPGVYIAVVLPNAAKGPTNTPMLCTQTSQALATFTPFKTVEVGYDNSYFSMLAALQKSNTVWGIRPATNTQAYGGLKLFSTVLGTAATGTAAIPDPTAYSFGTESLLITGTDPGSYNNSLAVTLINYKTSEVVSLASSVFTVAQDWGTGYPVRISAGVGGSLPAPLSLQSTYFIIRESATTVKIAISQANAFASTPVPITITGSPTSTLTLVPAISYATQPGTFQLCVYQGTNLESPIETWICSRDTSLLNSLGQNTYIENVLKQSNYISGLDNVLVTDPMLDQLAPTFLTNGADGSPALDGDCIVALNTIANSNFPVTVIIDGGRATVEYQQAMYALTISRMDCVAILSTPYDYEVSANYLNEVVDYRLFELNAATSYAAIYSSHVLIEDIYNNRELYVSPDGFVGGLISQTAANFDLWWPVAGFRRGVINVIDVAHRWSNGEMDYLYDNDINPIRFAPGRGIVVWGQKTLLGQPSVLNRLNVRLLAIAIEPQIKIALEDFLFEFNDVITRSNIVLILNAFFTKIQAGRGITGFNVVCDTTNNLASDIENNILNVAGYIIPNEAAETINFTLVFTPQGMSFSMAQSLT